MMTTVLLFFVGIGSFIVGAYWGMARLQKIAEDGLINYIAFLKYKIGNEELSKINLEYANKITRELGKD